MTEPTPSKADAASRRDFLKATTAAAAVAGLGTLSNAHAAGSDTIKVGLIGCGGPGPGAGPPARRCPGPRRGRAVDAVRPQRQAVRHGRHVRRPPQVGPLEPEEAGLRREVRR